MAWTESHQALATHRKMLDFASELGIGRAEAIGWLHLFWWWALDNAPSGNLKGIKAQQIATAVAWPNDSNSFLSALINAGFVDRCGRGATGMRIHNWNKYGGKLCAARDAHKQRMRRSRAALDNTTLDKSRSDHSRSEKPLLPPTPSPAACGGSDDPYGEPTDEEVAATVAAVNKRFGKNAKVRRVR